MKIQDTLSTGVGVLRVLKIVMDATLVQNGVMDGQFVMNFVMDANIDPKVVMDLSIFKIGGWKQFATQ